MTVTNIVFDNVDDDDFDVNSLNEFTFGVFDVDISISFFICEDVNDALKDVFVDVSLIDGFDEIFCDVWVYGSRIDVSFDDDIEFDSLFDEHILLLILSSTYVPSFV